jgi:purine nucleoside phosphorylase
MHECAQQGSRQTTFYEKGVVAHVGFSEPTCKILRNLLIKACEQTSVVFHPQGVGLPSRQKIKPQNNHHPNN